MTKFSVVIENPYCVVKSGTLASLYRRAYDLQPLSDPTWYNGRHRALRLFVEVLFRIKCLKTKSAIGLWTQDGFQTIEVDDLNTQFHSVLFERFANCYEPEVVMAIMAGLRDSRNENSFWDVGSNWGHFDFLLFAKLGSKVKCVLFDPQSECIEFANQTSKALGCSESIQGVNAALGEGVVEGRYFIPKGFHGGIAEVSATKGKGRRCKITKGDTVPDAKYRAPDVIKIDVEGSEASVIRGLRDTLVSLNPIVIFEYFTEADRRHDPQLVREIEALDYELIYLDYEAEWECHSLVNTANGPMKKRRTTYQVTVYSLYDSRLPRRPKLNLVACPKHRTEQYLQTLQSLSEI